jgi:hypothetical protein
MKKLNCGPGDLAMLVDPVHPENKGKICRVVQNLPVVNGEAVTGWWFCQFPEPVKTDSGPSIYTSTEDRRLRKIAGPDVDIGIEDAVERPEACEV